MAGRQAWCPRCDELRSARAGSPCPACSSTLLRLPSAERRPTPAGWQAAATGRLRALLPAATTLAVGLAVVAVVAGAFAAGRVTRTTPSAGPVASVPTETASDDSGPPTGGDSVYRWTSRQQGKLTLTLERIQVREQGSTLTVDVDGLAPGEAVMGLRGVSITDKDGGQLLRGGPIDYAPTTDSGTDGGATEVILRSPVEPLAAVAAVTVQGVFVTDQTAEEAEGTLVHPGLRPSDEPIRPETPPVSCPGCRVSVRCTRCRTMQVAASDYRRRDVVILLTPKGPRAQSVLGPDVVEVTIVNATTDIQPTVSTGPDGTTAVRFPAEALASDGGGGRHDFLVSVQSHLEHQVVGPWRMRGPP